MFSLWTVLFLGVFISILTIICFVVFIIIPIIEDVWEAKDENDVAKEKGKAP